MKERLQKIIASHGLCSRRTAEEWIREGRVSLNGQPAVIGDLAEAGTDRILVDGEPLPTLEAPVYLMLHKPRGYVTTLSDEKGRPTVASLVDCGCRVYPIGRLDCNSEGLLLFTNDGDFANRMMHPGGEVAKVYEVKVRGDCSQAEALLSRPIVLDGYQIRKPIVKCIRTLPRGAVFHITIFEGRNRQIRRMCELAGLTVLRLRRIREGSLELGDLPCGKWRYLTSQELRHLEGEVRHG